MLDYDMIASTNYIPFVYIGPQPASHAPVSCPPAADEAILGGLHNDYLKQKLNMDSTLYAGRQPLRLRRASASRSVPATGLYTGAETPKTGCAGRHSTAARPASRPTRATTSGATRCST